jgi:small subunit ribosomal protein S20
MPQLQAAKKALRVSQRKRTLNDRWRQRLRYYTRLLKKALSASDKTEAASLLVKTESVLHRAARRHIIHPNKAARLTSRYTQAVGKLK